MQYSASSDRFEVDPSMSPGAPALCMSPELIELPETLMATDSCACGPGWRGVGSMRAGPCERAIATPLPTAAARPRAPREATRERDLQNGVLWPHFNGCLGQSPAFKAGRNCFKSAHQLFLFAVCRFAAASPRMRCARSPRGEGPTANKVYEKAFDHAASKSLLAHGLSR